jgi:hypothetical protein
MVESSTPPEVEVLQTALEQQISPFDRDVVITNDAAEYVRRHSLGNPTNDRIGKLLCRPPFGGVRHRFTCKGRTYRSVILRNASKWAQTSAVEILSHICNEDVDLCS